MKAAIPICLMLLLAAGCASGSWRQNNRDVRASNAQAYDSYVVRRADELAGGGKYTRAQAESIATDEATRRYGTRTDGAGSVQAAGWTWSSNKTEAVSPAELDQALKKSGAK